MITFDRVTVMYAEAAQPTLRDVTLEIAEGELCLVMGSTGTGKSTLLRCVNG
jgi:energy-coupling factor transport system ATP-binding protein